MIFLLLSLFSHLYIKQQMSNKKNNARIQKWRAMLSAGLLKDQKLLHSRVRKGIPSSIRIIAWPELVGLKKHIQQRSVEISYNKLLNSLSNNVYEITLDIPRTFPEQEESKVLRKSMNNVLKAIAIVHPKIGYCQGMNFLALRLLQILDDEQTFWLLDYLFENDRYLRNNFMDPKQIQVHNHNFEILLNKSSPQLLQTLKEKGIHLHAYTMKCFMTLFSAVLRQEFFNRVFQVYLLEGWSIIYAVAIVLFKRHDKEFRTLSMEQIHVMLGKKIFEVSDIDEVINQACEQNITSEKVGELERIYLQTLRKSQKLNPKSSQLQNREMANRNVHKFTPQNQNIGLLIFQNKAEEVSFEALYILKNKT